jgi:hypothetical protein
MRYYFTFILFFIFLTSKCQNDKFYQFSKDILSNSRNISQDLSFISLFKLSQEYDEKESYHKYTPLSSQDSLKFLKYKPRNAKKYIIEQAKNKQIVMINEAHYDPMHRAFTYSLLKELYDLGFRYFGAETFSHYDTLLNQRGYPVTRTGYFTNEPVFGELVRYALELGYTLFPYEDTSKVDNGYTKKISPNGDTLIFYNSKFRDEIQAKFITKILEKDPKAKILIHAGYGHICEYDTTSMGYFVKKYSGIDPLTIGQTNMIEKLNKKHENPYYSLCKITEPTVFVDSSNKAFVYQKNCFDVTIFSPPTTYQSGRPDWLSLNGIRKPVYLDFKNEMETTPCLVFAYYESEYKKNKQNAVPADVIEIDDLNNKIPLFLKPGDYIIVTKTDKGVINSFNYNVN